MWGLMKTKSILPGKNLSNIRYYHLKKAKMVSFNSLIVFDTETTGLPYLEGNNTRITEMALIGCEVSHIKEAKELPRVLHKLVFCFNPMKAILPDSSNITGLENEMLMNIKPFNITDAEVLTHFINRLPSPVCIVAHNGNKFDFPILQKHLHKLNFKLPDNVYCLDSLKAFQDIYPNPKQSYSNYVKSNTVKPNFGQLTPAKQELLTPVSDEEPDIQIVFDSQITKPKVVRTLFPEATPPKVDSSSLSQTNEITLGTPVKAPSPPRYNLISIYEFLHGKCYPDSHRAEDDCKALLCCIIKCDKFLNWMNEKAVSFNSIKPLL